MRPVNGGQARDAKAFAQKGAGKRHLVPQALCTPVPFGGSFLLRRVSRTGVSAR